MIYNGLARQLYVTLTARKIAEYRTYLALRYLKNTSACTFAHTLEIFAYRILVKRAVVGYVLCARLAVIYDARAAKIVAYRPLVIKRRD